MTDTSLPGNVVVAVDGSEPADRAVQWAAEQAALEGRDLTVLAAFGMADVPPVTWAGMGAAYSWRPKDLRAHALLLADRAADLARTVRPDLRVHSQVAMGDPRQVLTDASRSAHLMVLGSRGRGPLTSKLLGSVGAAVSRDAACPVVICRPTTRPGSRSGILVGADGTQDSVVVVEFAFAQAALHGVGVTVRHALWDQVGAALGPVPVPAEEPGLEEQRLLLAETVAGLGEKFPDVPVELDLQRGMAEECLAADSDRWSLIVVGRHPVDTLVRLVSGAVATSVVEHARTAVAVVPLPAPR